MLYNIVLRKRTESWKLKYNWYYFIGFYFFLFKRTKMFLKRGIKRFEEHCLSHGINFWCRFQDSNLSSFSCEVEAMKYKDNYPFKGVAWFLFLFFNTRVFFRKHFIIIIFGFVRNTYTILS